MDPVEGRRCCVAEPIEGKTTGMLKPQDVSTKQHRIAELARTAPDMAMNLSHHIDVAWLREAFRLTRKTGAAGVDGQTGRAYGEDLENRLVDLLNRAKSGRYRAPAVRRVHIPKGDGRTRPLGIPTFEDKLLQRAVAMALEPVFEQDFLGCSHGFRPGRSAHTAIKSLWSGLMKMGGGYVIDLDIKAYFDTVDHRIIQGLFAKRVRDGVVRRLIGKWLNARIREKGRDRKPDAGVPQGGVISPLLSNIYLHEVLDTWFEQMVKPVLAGDAFMVRYADDAVLVFADGHDAQRVLRTLPKRFAKYGLTLHPQKTKLVDFRRSPRGATFDFLGFTFYWTWSRQRRLVVKHKTSQKAFRRSVQAMHEWLRDHRHDPIDVQHKEISVKLRGHFNYYGLTGNGNALATFLHWVTSMWLKWLRTRGGKRRLTWAWFRGFLSRCPLPKPTPVHSVLLQSRSETAT